MTIVLENLDVWNIEDGDVFDFQIQAGTGSELHYTADRTDSGTSYIVKTGGEVIINANITLTSITCTYDDATIVDNTTGAAYYIDTIGAGGAWVVSNVELPSVDYDAYIISSIGYNLSIAQTLDYESVVIQTIDSNLNLR